MAMNNSTSPWEVSNPDYKIHKNVLRRFIIMHTINIWQLRLQFMIHVLNKKHKPGQKPKGQDQQVKKFQILIFGDPMLIPRRHVLIHKFLLTLPIKR